MKKPRMRWIDAVSTPPRLAISKRRPASLLKTTSMIHDSGRANSREEFAASVSKLRRLTDPRRPLIRSFKDDVAIMTGPLTPRVGRNGEGQVAHMYAAQVAHRSNGDWKFVSTQVTPIRA
jgi:hypothetical protein